MALAGCTGVFVGSESLSNENILDQNKRSLHTSAYAERVRTFHADGIQLNGSFVLGFDHDDKSFFDRTFEWFEEQRLECTHFHLLTLYPGTPLFHQMN